MRTHNSLKIKVKILTFILVFLSFQVEARLRQLEGKIGGESAAPRGLPSAQKYDSARQGGATVATPKAYNADADVTADADGKKEKKKKKKEKEANGDVEEKKEKKEKKRKDRDDEDGEKKKKKKKKDKSDE